MNDSKKYLARGLLSPVLDWPEQPSVDVVVYVDDEIDQALVNWTWPESRTTLH
jgi:hypothetical protein